jgi:predicted transcriptional regulator
MVAGMTRRQVLVQLDDGQVAALDRLADAADDSRSELIRRAIDLYVEAVGEAVADLRYADAYHHVPEDLEEFSALRDVATWPRD